MRSSLLTLISIIWFVSSGFAQERAKYEIIRETIDFLATDEKVSQDTSFRISCESLDYDCFSQALSSRPILGIERWYNRWRAMEVNDTTGLIALRDRIFRDIFERPGKSYRKQLAGYPAYIARTERFIEQYRNDPFEQTRMDTAQALPEGLAENYAPDTLQPGNPGQPEPEAGNLETNNPMIAYLALALGIIALIFAILPSLRKKEPQTSPDNQALANRLDDISLRIKRLERQTTKPEDQDALKTLTEIMESVEKRVVELENRSESGAG